MQRRLLHPHHYLRHLPPHTLALFLPPASPPLHLPLHLLLFLLQLTSHHVPCFLNLLLYPRPRPAAPLTLTSILSALLDPETPPPSLSQSSPREGSPQAPSYPMAAVPTLLLCGSLGSSSFQDFFPLESQPRRTSRYWRGGFVTLVTHSGFIINTHNLSVRQENALELFLWSRCKIRNNVLSNIFSGGKVLLSQTFIHFRF